MDIKLPFAETYEIRNNSIFNKSKTSVEDFLQLFKSVPAFVKFAQVKGEDKWKNLEQSFIDDFLHILNVPKDADLASIILDTCHDYFVVMARQEGTS